MIRVCLYHSASVLHIPAARTTRSSGEDHHGKIAEGVKKERSTSDKPITNLLSDLKARRLLDDRLMLWGGEFGRTPHTQQNEGPGQTPRRE
ncbi:DUF1501 domain-containing protein [bacterium]|nr:DUF1501 domain-containing protein [bacterium]